MTESLLRNVAPAPARTPALSARGIFWGSSAKSVSAAGRKDPFGGDQVSALDFVCLFFHTNMCNVCVWKRFPPTTPPAPSNTPRPSLEQQRQYTAVKGSNLSRRRQIFSAVRERKSTCSIRSSRCLSIHRTTRLPFTWRTSAA